MTFSDVTRPINYDFINQIINEIDVGDRLLMTFPRIGDGACLSKQKALTTKVGVV